MSGYFIQGIAGVTIYAKKNVFALFYVINKTFCLSLHYNGDSSYLFVNGKEVINFKAKDSEIITYPLWLGNISVDLNQKITDAGLNGCIYYFSVDYNAITNGKILDIHHYSMKNNNIL